MYYNVAVSTAHAVDRLCDIYCVPIPSVSYAFHRMCIDCARGRLHMSCKQAGASRRQAMTCAVDLVRHTAVSYAVDRLRYNSGDTSGRPRMLYIETGAYGI